MDKVWTRVRNFPGFQHPRGWLTKPYLVQKGMRLCRTACSIPDRSFLSLSILMALKNINNSHCLLSFRYTLGIILNPLPVLTH